jgi:hypothetical protein
MKMSCTKQAVVLACLALSLLSACDSLDLSALFVTPVTSEASRTQTVSISDGARLVVNNDNGSTRITVDSDATEATIKIARIAYAQDEATADTLLDEIAVTVTEPTWLNNTLTIDAPRPASATNDENNFSVDLSGDQMEVTGILLAQQVAVVQVTITLPAGISVQATHKNGVIRVTGLDSDTTLTMENGNVRVLESAADVTVAVTDGQVIVSDHEGSLDADVDNGAIKIEVASLSSSEEIKARAANGQITLTVPKDIDADLTAETAEGTVSFDEDDFDDVSNVNQTQDFVTATVNDGGPTINLYSENGLISVSAD